MEMFSTLMFCISALFIQGVKCIILHDIEIPELVKIEKFDGDNGNEIESIKLDCKYEFAEDPSYLVVKWFMNDKGIYQWIRGQKPSVLPYFKHHIGEIEATSSNKNYEYRGLTLINPTIELSGTYKCLVQTDRGSKAMEKELHVVDVSNSSIVFDNHPVQNETYLECIVTNIFPKPRINLVSTDENIILSSNETRITKLDNNYYNASMTAVAQNTDDDADAFYCFVTFDGLSLNFTVDTVRSTATKNCVSRYPLLLIVTIMFLTKFLEFF